MKKKLLTLLITLTMVFSMAVPAFAAEASKETTLMMTGLGDSIASGCTNIDFIWDGGSGADIDGEFRDFVTFTNGEKDYNCDAVKLSFVSKLYRALGANKYSMNLSFPGLRAKDFCRIVGQKPLREGDFDDSWWWAMATMCNEDLLLNDYNTQQYKSAIKHSDVIAVELGENDLTTALINNYDKIENIFMTLAELLPTGSPEQAVVEDLADQTADLNKEITGKGDTCVIERIIEEISKDIEELQKLGEGIEEIIKGLVEITNEMALQNRYYFKSMMSYIEKNSKPGAVVVVGTMINPFKDMDDDTGITQLMNLVIEPFVKDTNAFIRSQASKYGYTVADISSVSVNPGEPYFLHPDENGQQVICDKFAQAINKSLTKCRKDKLGVSVELQGAKEATYLEDGYTGDEVCADCGDVLMRGSVIPKLAPNATKIKKIKATSKKITVNWAKAADVDGYQIQCSTAAKFNKNKKTVTVNKATATKAEVKKIKSGKKYYVRVRTFKKVQNAAGETVKVYSKWSPVKTTKTK